MTELVDFTDCPFSFRHGSYSGNAGGKKGIVYQGEPWIIKYPKNTRSMRGAKLPSYTMSPLSEYLGSHVYEILGVPVHRTLLGVDGGKLVVACKDFRPDNAMLMEFRSVKNAMTPELSDFFEEAIPESATGDRVNLQETLVHLEHNPLCKAPGVQERFASMVVADAIIDNNDRNNGNWGFLAAGGKLELAPVFDNGNAYANKVDDEHLDLDPLVITEKWASGRSIYESAGHQLSNRNLFAQSIPMLAEVVASMVKTFWERHEEVELLLRSLPCEYKGIPVISHVRADAYMEGMDARVRWLAEDFGLK